MPGIVRDLEPDAPEGVGWTPSGKSYVVAIGISKYTYLNSPLPNAEKDAHKALEVLAHCEFTEPPGVLSLFNEQATRDALNTLVIDKLPHALTPDDSLILFYSGHGDTVTDTIWDPEHPGQKKTVCTGYLLPADAKRDERSTWLRLDAFLDQIATLPALHILVILDACKSGFALADKFRLRDAGAGLSGTLADLAQRPSRRVMTSAMFDERAMDGGGLDNSLFTDTLADAIESMAPDQDGDGYITSRQLFDYVQPRVGDKALAAFNMKQTPDYGCLGLDGSGDLILSLQGDRFKLKQAGENLKAADAVYRLGQMTGEKQRFDFAARLYRDARDLFILGRAPSPDAELGLGKALLAAGQLAEAVKTLSALSQTDAAPADAGLWLGVTLARQRAFAPAAEALAAWSAAHADRAAAPWAASYATWLSGAAAGKTGRRRALLIGINEYQLPRATRLNGCRNDAALLIAPALSEHCGFAPDDMTVLLDKDATLAAIRQGFQRLADDSRPEDVVWVFFSGHAVPALYRDGFGPNEAEKVYLIAHDTNITSGQLANGMPAAELHDWMQKIAAERKVLALDTHADADLMELCRTSGNYTLILASDSAEIAFEYWTDLEGKRQPCGILSLALRDALLSGDPETIRFDDLMLQAVRRAEEITSDTLRFPSRQTPFLEGPRGRLVFGPEDLFLAAFDFAEHGDRPEFQAHDIAGLYARAMQRCGEVYPPAHLAFGRALLKRAAWEEAAHALEQAAGQATDPCDPAHLALTQAYLLGRRYDAAQAALARLSPKCAEVTSQIAPLLASLAASRKLLLVVDVSGRTHRGIKPPPVSADELVKVLVARWGFDEAAVTRLAHPATTSAAVHAAFDQALKAAGPGGAVLFYYLGYAAWFNGLWIEMSDEGLLAEELAAQAAGSGVDVTFILDGRSGRHSWLEEATEAVRQGSKRFGDQAALDAYVAGLAAAGVWVTSGLPRESST